MIPPMIPPIVPPDAGESGPFRKMKVEARPALPTCSAGWAGAWPSC